MIKRHGRGLLWFCTKFLVIVGVLVMLWWWALSTSLAEPRALFVAVGFALIFGVMTEVAQSAVPDREVSLFDLAVNWSVTIIAAVLISSRWRKPQLPGV